MSWQRVGATVLSAVVVLGIFLQRLQMDDKLLPRNLGDEARAELASLIDLQMSPLGLAAMHILAPKAGDAILDVGCGAGETLVQLANRVGANGTVVGLDIAPRVLQIARSRSRFLPQVKLLQGDAALLDLPDSSFDGIYSRFGTMFFVEPVVAFSNLRRMLKPGGRLAFVCWRSFDENELDTFPMEVAGFQGEPQTAPFSLEKAKLIEDVLTSAGFKSIEIKPQDLTVSCGGTEETLQVLTRVGALGMILREKPELLPFAISKVRAALVEREVAGQVSLGTATWIVTATSD